MFLFNPPDPTAEPINRIGWPAIGDVVTLPPAWRINISPQFLSTAGVPELDPPGQPLTATVEALAPFQSVQRIRWHRTTPSQFRPIPSAGFFRLSFNADWKLAALPHYADCRLIEQHIEHAARLAEMGTIRARVDRDSNCGLLITLQADGETRVFPQLQIQTTCTAGQVHDDDRYGRFVLQRHLAYSGTAPRQTVPGLPYNEQSALNEWTDSPFLWTIGDPVVWYRSTRPAGEQSGRSMYWQIGYQLATDYNADNGQHLNEPGWCLYFGIEYQKHAGINHGCVWPLNYPNQFIADRPATFGTKSIRYGTTDPEPSTGVDQVYFDLPETITAYPDYN